jgi:uncharacterized membrane protein YdbT with pleckstrin-like domain
MAGKVKTHWKGTPSHYDSFGSYILVALLAIPTLGISLLYGIYVYMNINATNYTLTDEAILRKTGVFNRKTDELMLYRIQDITMEEPFFLRMVKLSNLKIFSTDVSTPEFTLTSLEDGEKLRKAIRVLSEKQRKIHGVRSVDITRN